MERNLAHPLPRGARVALLVNDALGNLCVGTIVAQGLRRLAPDLELHWFGGPRTAELEGAHDMTPRPSTPRRSDRSMPS